MINNKIFVEKKLEHNSLWEDEKQKPNSSIDAQTIAKNVDE